MDSSNILTFYKHAHKGGTVKTSTMHDGNKVTLKGNKLEDNCQNVGHNSYCVRKYLSCNTSTSIERKAKHSEGRAVT